MKKILILFLMVIVLLNGCITSNNSESNNQNFEQEIKWNYWSSFDVLIQQNKNYKVFADKQNTGYYYIVTDDNGNNLDEGYHSWRGDIHFEEKENLLILWYGFGFSSWQCRYYDVAKEKVSRFFWKPVQSSDKLIVYFKTDEDEKITLIVQDIFDVDKYYKEIEREFSGMVIRDFCQAEFLDDNKLRITYWINPDDVEITEIISLD